MSEQVAEVGVTVTKSSNEKLNKAYRERKAKYWTKAQMHRLLKKKSVCVLLHGKFWEFRFSNPRDEHKRKEILALRRRLEKLERGL